MVVPKAETQGESMEEEEGAVVVSQNPWLPGYARSRGAILEAICDHHRPPPLRFLAYKVKP